MKRCKSAVWLAGVTLRFTAALNNGENYSFISIGVIAHGQRMEYLSEIGARITSECPTLQKKRFLKSEKHGAGEKLYCYSIFNK